MRLLKTLVFTVAILTSNVIAGVTQLEAVLPTCAVSDLTVLVVIPN